MPSALQLDLSPTTPLRSRLLGIAALALAAVAAAATAERHDAQQQRLDTLRDQHERLQRRLAAAAAPAASAPDAPLLRRLAQARAVVQPLAVPWGALFAALESVPTRGVVLQQLSPDAQTSRLQLAGQAPSLAEALAYVQRLSGHPLLTEVHLLSTEPLAREGAPLLAFTLQARWRQP